MKIRLNFNLGDKTNNKKIVDFPSIAVKDEYVAAEFKDPLCREAYFAYQEARTLDQRLQAAKKLDNIRIMFYKRWTKTNENLRA